MNAGGFHASSPRERMVGAVATGVVMAVLLAGLGWGLAAGRLPPILSQPELLVVPTRPPSPPAPPPRVTVSRPSPARRAPAPPNLRNTATPVVAPPPIVRLPVPPPVIAAPRPNLGMASQSGASDRPGPGEGAGGNGDGTGGGGDGDGDGYTPPVQIRGSLRYSDLPAEVRQGQDAAGLIGSVEVRYYVGVDGRVGDCAIVRSSGKPAIDAVTCETIRSRFRFRPSLDPNGRPIGSHVAETHTWEISREDRPAPRD